MVATSGVNNVRYGNNTLWSKATFPDSRTDVLYLIRTKHLIKEDHDVAQKSGVQQFCREGY
jgi:hypothetical protein